MTPSLSVRALEHWGSTHLTYRYGAHARQTWPTAGDATVASSPHGAQQLWLEFVSTQWRGKDKGHALVLDLEQLRRYGAQAVPDYYVFPAPPWRGVLGKKRSLEWLGDLDPTDLGFSSHAGGRWFPRWTRVVSGARLRTALGSKLGGKKGSATLGRVVDGEFLPAKGAKAAAGESWHEFLNAVDAGAATTSKKAASTKGFVWTPETSRTLIALTPRES